MIKRILGLVLIFAGVWLFAAGWSRKDSLMGSLAETGTSIANKFDGGARTPKHMIYLGGGVLVAVSGAILVFSRQN
ncbi:MAG: DUF3185 family protein [Nibricoccus sp.]